MISTEERNGACPRCHGFLVPMIGDGSEAVVLDWSELPGWRCINCGERIDRLILVNRRAAEGAGTMTDKRLCPGVNGHDRRKESFEKISRSSEQAASMKRSEKGCRL